MTRKLKRDRLWKEVLESGIFTEPALFFHRGWGVSFIDERMLTGRNFVIIGQNIDASIAWLQRTRGTTYPQH